MDRLNSIKQELSEMCYKEYHKLFRLARKAAAHGVNMWTVRSIRDEAWEMYHIHDYNCEAILNDEYMSKFEYAFKF